MRFATNLDAGFDNTLRACRRTVMKTISAPVTYNTVVDEPTWRRGPQRLLAIWRCRERRIMYRNGYRLINDSSAATRRPYELLYSWCRLPFSYVGAVARVIFAASLDCGLFPRKKKLTTVVTTSAQHTCVCGQFNPTRSHEQVRSPHLLHVSSMNESGEPWIVLCHPCVCIKCHYILVTYVLSFFPMPSLEITAQDSTILLTRSNVSHIWKWLSHSSLP